MNTNDANLQFHGPSWSREGTNLFNDSNLELVRNVLQDDVVCGLHLLYAGGASGHAVAFRTYDAYFEYLSKANPGDLFILWSIAKLREKEMLLLDVKHETRDSNRIPLLSAKNIDVVQDYLRTDGHEILAIASIDNEPPQVIWTDLNGSQWDAFLHLGHGAYVGKSSLCVLPLTAVDVPDFYLIKGKRPNQMGETPLGGAY